jgi:hypothetical protein
MPTKGAGTNAVSYGRAFGTTNKYFGTLLNAFTFDAPIVSYQLNPTFSNGATTGGLTLSVDGFAFGAADFSGTGSIGATACTTLSWKSETQIHCITAPGAGSKKALTVTVGAVVGTIVSRFTFDAPVLTSHSPQNGPSMSGYLVTVSGQNYGATNLSPSVRLGATMCSSSQWLSDTSLKCAVTAGFEGNHILSVTIEAIVGTRVSADTRFTFNAPVPTHTYPVNQPTSAGASVTFVGLGFGSVDFSPTVGLADVGYACATTGWSTATSLTCKSSLYDYGTASPVVTVGQIVGTRILAFSYDAPVMSVTSASNLVTTAGATITINGLNFAGVSATPTALLGDVSTACTTTSWTSVSTILCANGAGSGAGNAVQQILAGSVGGTALKLFTYDAPAGSYYTSFNTPTSGGSITTVMGINFGASVLTSTVRIGSSTCGTVSWSSNTALHCYTVAGHSTQHTAAISVTDLVGSSTGVFTFDSPALTYAQRFNTPTCEGVSITISGMNLGVVNLTPSAVIGGSLCTSSQWASATAVKCASPSGYGTSRHVAITVGSLIGTAAAGAPYLFSGFTYDAPVVTYTIPTNTVTSSGSTITMNGFNFAMSSVSTTIGISSTVCATSSWTALTTVKCTAPYGGGSDFSMVVTIGSQVWSKSKAFTYDAPVVTFVDAYNLPLTNTHSVTLMGTNFAYFDPSPTTKLGETMCLSASWNSQTSIRCDPSQSTMLGVGAAVSPALTVTTVVGTAFAAFSYDAPSVSNLLPSNGIPTASGAGMGGATPGSITVLGFNFANTDPSATGYLGSLPCGSMSWYTNTHMTCVTSDAPGGIMVSSAVTISSLVGTLTGTFTYDAPIITGGDYWRNVKLVGTNLVEGGGVNVVASQGASVTLFGFNFGGLAPTPSISIGKTMCTTTSWTSSTKLTCSSIYAGGPSSLKQSVSLTINTQVGTKINFYTYDAPIISQNIGVLYAGSNAPMTGGTLITVRGINFLGVDATPSMTVVAYACGTTSWSSGTSLLCEVPPSSVSLSMVANREINKAVGVTISQVVGTSNTNWFSFDSPVISYMGGLNGPTSGHNAVTIDGINFGAPDYTPTAVLGSTRLSTVTWTSTTSVTTVGVHGVGSDLDISLTINSLIGTQTSAFTFDSPVVTQADSRNGATSGLTSVTLSGSNFGMQSVSATSTVGETVCQTTAYVSSTSLVCASPAGTANGKYVSVTVSGLLGTQLNRFSYDGPALTDLMPYNAPTSAGASVTFTGTNFATADPTPTTVLGVTVCGTTKWTAVTSVTCMSPSGYGVSQHTEITVAEVVSTRLSAFSYDAPALTALVRNAPTESSATLSLRGVNFAMSDPSASIRIGLTSCQTSSWVSTTAVLCLTPDGYAVQHTAAITIDGVPGSATQVFSYDSPAVTFVNRFNAPTSGSASLSVMGVNFATSNTTPSVVIGSTFCGSTSWTSTTAVICASADGYSTTTHVAVIVAGLTGTEENSFTYDSPVVTYADLFNQPTSGGTSLTITGVNFGSVNLTPASGSYARIGMTECATTSYTSDTSLLCQGEQGSGYGLNSMLTVSSLVGTRENAFSFDTPITSQLQPANMVSTAYSSITLIGVNFGSMELSGTAVIGTTLCQTSSWASYTHLLCEVLPGIGKSITSTVEVSSLIGTLLAKFSYDSPTVSYNYVKNGPTSGSTELTLSGLNFGMQDYTPTVELSTVLAGTASWVSETQLKITSSAETGYDEKVTVEIMSLMGTATAAWTYDAPTLSSSYPTNEPTSAGSNAIISLHGVNFGLTDGTPTVLLGSTQCATARWTSETQVTCNVVEGTSYGHIVQLTLNSLVGTATAMFSFDSPALSMLINVNGASTGSSSVTVQGLNFANIDTTASLRIGTSHCGTTSWSSSTALSCLTLGGLYDASTQVTATISEGVSGTLLAAFSYDTPVISNTAPPNGPTSAGMSVSIAGMNFGGQAPSATAAIGASVCVTTAWYTDSSIRCLVTSAGASDKIATKISLSSLVGTMVRAFTFDAPSVTQTALINAPTCGLTSVTLSGFNFGMSGYTPSVKIGDSVCRTTSWTSVSSVACGLLAGSNLALPAALTMDTLVGTQLASFTYDAPVISSRRVDNGPLSGGTSVTIFGANYGMSNVSPSAALGSSICSTASWKSDSAVVCTTASGASTGLDLVLTVGSMVATTEDTFTYDSPVITDTKLYNIPTTGGGQVTVYGTNFGAYDWTPTFRIHSTVCSTTSWSTSSAVTCVAPPGYGVSRDLMMSVAGVIGTVHGLFSYDSPLITGLTLGNSPTTGGKSVTIQGGNFAIEDGTVTALVGTSMCATSSWTSASVVKCLLGGVSAGSNFQVALTLVGLVGTKQNVFTFDAPAITWTYQFNAPLSGHPSITLTGTNFASQDFSMDGYVGSSLCMTTSWMTVTSAKCLVAAGFGQGLMNTLTVSSLIGTRNMGFSYDSPTVTYASVYNAPNSAGVSITISGTNFGAEDYSVTVQVADTACLTSKWVSMTSATCELATGVGVGPTSFASEHRVALTVGTGVGTRTRSFTFDAPVVTYAARFNAASTGGQSVTVNGVNFGLSDYSVTVGIGKTACMTTTWSSNTGLLCAAPAGGGYGYQVAVTVLGIDGTIKSMFTYDAPVLTRVASTNSAVSGYSLVTLHGTGFGLSDNTPTVNVAKTACASTSWTTMSSVSCYSPYGTGSGHDVLITVTSMVGTEAQAFTYDAPILSQLQGDNGPITGGTSVTLTGSNFGLTDLTPTALIGSTQCATSVWTSSTVVKCATSFSGGYGVKKSGMVELAGLSGTILDSFTYDAPTISITELTNGPSTTGARVTVSGSDFGQMNLTPTARVGKTRCATTSWMSSTSLICSLASGAGSTLHSGVNLFSLEATLSDVFTYDSPTITTVGSNGPTTGGNSLTIVGTNFGAEDFSASARIGSTSCTRTDWIATTSVSCVSAGGATTAVAESLTVAGVVGTQTSQYSFDGPLISGLNPANAPLTGESPISVLGLNFATTDLSPTATIMHSTCLTTSWTTDTTITCQSIAGYGTGKVVGLTVHSVVATAESAFTFDAPVVTAGATINNPSSSGASVTVSGLNFISTDLTPSMAVGSTMCSTSSWSSATTVQCGAAGISGTGTHSLALQVASLSGTQYEGFSFDAPSASFIAVSNGATSGGSPVTVHGLNFANTDITPTLRVGGAVCSTSSWSSATRLYCMNSAASGIAQSVAMEVTGLIGTMSYAFTYDAPASSHAVPLNTPTSSGATISVYGNNFGMSDFTPSIQMGVTVCATVTWTTTTAINCRAAAGYTSDLKGTLSISSMVGTHIEQHFTYDAPTVTYTTSMNAPTTSGASVTVQGVNFHGSDLTATIMLSTDACTTTSWSSITALSCQTPSGAGFGKSVVVVQDTLTGTQYLGFSYDSPVITSVATRNGPTSGASVTTIMGLNFGAADLSLTAKLGVTSCASTDWITETAVLCLNEAGFGIKGFVTVVLDDHSGTLAAGFTYDTAVLTAVSALNSPTSGGAMITLSGFNMVDQYDPTPSVRLGMTDCLTTSWSSVSALSCLSAVGIGSSQLVSATVGNQVATLSASFTYDSPVVTLVTEPNMPSTAGTSLTLGGVNFGLDGGTPTVEIGGLACSDVKLVTDTSIVCKPSAGIGSAHSVAVNSNSIAGTLITSFTYDAPAVTFISKFNAPTSGGASLTVSGVNLGNSDYSVSVNIAGTSCLTSSWKSDSSVVCLSASGTGPQKSSYVTVAQIVGTALETFTYDSPVLTSVARVNAAGTGKIWITVSGTNFAETDKSAVLKVGQTNCGTTSWSSQTAMGCYLERSGNGIGLKLSVATDTLLGTGLSLFSYDAPVVTFISPVANAATTAGTIVTIAGANFGHENFSGTSYIGATGCTLTTYVTNSLVTCTVPAGSGQQQRAIFSRDGVSGTMVRAFTYDAPIITDHSPSNGPAKSGATVMVHGTNFGPQGTSPTVLVGNSWCTNSEWLSTTSLKCITPDGTNSNHHLGVVVTSLLGTSIGVFTYDAPRIISMSVSNAPMVSGAPLTLFGQNFGNSDVSATITVGATACASVGWVSDSALMCLTPNGAGSGLDVALSLAGTTASISGSFTHDSPTITKVEVINGPTAGGSIITLQGDNFGYSDLSLTASVGGEACTASTYVSATSVQCTVAAGGGPSKDVKAVLNSLEGDAKAAFSYDSPSLVSITPSRGHYLGRSFVTVTGTNFGSSTSNAVVSIGGTNCLTTSYVSSTQLTCEVPPASQQYIKPRAVAVKISDESSTLTEAFSYSSPTELFEDCLSGNCSVAPFNLSADAVTIVQVSQLANGTALEHRYEVSGTMGLNGRLHIEFEQGMTPSRVKCWEFFKGTGFTGTFSQITTNFDAVAYTDPSWTSLASVCTRNSKWSVKVEIPGCNTPSLGYTDCSGHGTCNGVTGNCECNPGYGGTKCDSVCFYNASLTPPWDCGCAKLS